MVIRVTVGQRAPRRRSDRDEQGLLPTQPDSRRRPRTRAAAPRSNRRAAPKRRRGQSRRARRLWRERRRRIGADPQALRRDDVEGSVERCTYAGTPRASTRSHVERDDPAVRPGEQRERGEQGHLIRDRPPSSSGTPRVSNEPPTTRGSVRAPARRRRRPTFAAALVSAATSAVADQHDLAAASGCTCGEPTGDELDAAVESGRHRPRKNVEPARGELSEDQLLADRVRWRSRPSCLRDHRVEGRASGRGRRSSGCP